MAPFQLPQPVKPLASPLMRLEEVAVGYAADRPVLTGLNLRIDQDDRIALLGQNGNGKSTFAKLIAGKLAPLAGKVFGAKRVDVGYFAQHQLDELNPRQDALRPHAGPDAGGDGGAAARAARHATASAPTRPTPNARTCRAARRRGCCWRSPPSTGRTC